jgi:hypothetical protein
MLTVLGGGTTQNSAFPNGTATITPFTGRKTLIFWNLVAILHMLLQLWWQHWEYRPWRNILTRL